MGFVWVNTTSALPMVDIHVKDILVDAKSNTIYLHL